MPLTPGMDYGSLLQLAHKTSEMKKAQRSTSKFPPVHLSKENKNAEDEKKKLLDANVAKFLAKRENEEKKKKIEANERRDGLLALRNKDSKARKRVKIMNKTAKSADRSVIDDATASTDYYVIEEPLCFMSQESLAQEEKFLQKLSKVPQEEIFSKKKANVNNDLSSTKDRVKMALLLGDTVEKKEKREAKEKLKENNLKVKGKSNNVKYEELEEKPKEEEKPKKPRHSRPPPLNYIELLKLAEKMQQEPVREELIEKEPEMRPMTTKEKELYLLEEASRKRKEEGWKVRSKKSDQIPSSVPLKTFKNSTLPAREGNKSIPPIPRIPKISESRPITQERKSDLYEDQKHKSIRGEKSAFSTQKLIHQSEEKASTSKPSSSRVGHSIAAKHHPVQDTSLTGRVEKEAVRNYSGEERSSHSIKMQGTKRDREEISSSKPPSRHKEKVSSVSQGMKDSKPRDTKASPSSIDGGKIRSNKPTDSSRTVQSQKSSTVLPNSKPREQKSSACELPKRLPSSGIKSRSGQVSSPKQSDVTAKPLPPSSKQQSTLTQARQLSTSEVKPRQQNSPSTKSSSLFSSDSKLSRNMPEIKVKQLSSSTKPKQQPSTVKSQQDSIFPKNVLSLPSDAKPRNIPPPVAKPRNYSPSDGKPRSFPPSNVKPRGLSPSDQKPKNFPPSDGKPRNILLPDVKKRNLPPSDGQLRRFPPNNGPKSFPPPDVRRKQFPPADLKHKQFPPADVRRGPKPPPAKKRRVIDSDEEYDSEVADFIDDGEDDGEDYSKHIRDIFGYDRSKYRGVDEDDECMESSFSQQMKEEFKSAKLGILEDLEDIRREKQREAMLKKKRKLK